MALGRVFSQRRALILWQSAFLLLGTSWLWAPVLNHNLSARLSLISQYENPSQPYSWLFRICDMAASLLLLVAAFYFLKDKSKKLPAYFLLVIGVGLFLDPLMATSCHLQGNVCHEYFSFNFLVHAIETTVTSVAVFGLSVYDSLLRKKLVSLAFVLFQLAYSVLFLSQLASQEKFNTVSQIFYQAIIIIWLTWYVADLLTDQAVYRKPKSQTLVRLAVSAWALFNGVLAIIISLSHIHLLGRIKGLYFAGDSAWLAQHGVVIGVIMIYLSRHLWRGERRARQIFLVITGLEVVKYAVIVPSPALLTLYSISFAVLFVLKDDFERGVISLTWRTRLRDIYIIFTALLASVLAALLVLDRDSKISAITADAFSDFFTFVISSQAHVHHDRRSALLAHTISAFLLISVAVILWALFRPYKFNRPMRPNVFRAYRLLKKLSNYPEDFFKIWPVDKSYFWQKNRQGFVAYKIAGPVVFALADPVSLRKPQLLNDFVAWAKARRLKVCFLPIYHGSLKLYEQAGLNIMQIGSSAVIDIQTFLKITANDKWWRWQKNRAARQGYQYGISRPPHQPEFIKQLGLISEAWLAKDDHQERGFALGYFDEEYLQNCQIYFLRDSNGRPIAFINQLPEIKKPQVASIDLMRHYPEANNAMPFLIYKIIEELSQKSGHYKYFDLGFVPFTKAKGSILSIVRTLSVGRFSVKGLEQFKNKFDPEWQPNYLAYDGDLADLALIAVNLERAMSIKN